MKRMRMASDPARFERKLLDSIAEQLDAAFALVHLAIVKRADGDTEQSRLAKGNAEYLVAEAERRMEQAASIGWDVTGLGGRVQKLRDDIKQLNRNPT